MVHCLFSAGLQIGFVLVVLWFGSDSHTSVNDVRQAETLVVGGDTGEKYPYAISIRGSGYLDGEATITLMLGERAYRVEKLSGQVDFHFGGDWYTETAELRYEPKSVRCGTVAIHYCFYR